MSKPDGLIIYPHKDIVGVDYIVNSNGIYNFIIENEDSTKTTKTIVVDTIDKLKPKDFEITAETTRTGGIVVNANWLTNITGYWTPEKAEIQTSGSGTKVETLEDMKKQETYVGFDFENIWIMKEYPELRCFTEE